MSWGIAIWAGMLAVVAALLAVTRPSVVHALLLLLASLVALGVAFLALAATFAGAVQFLIYAGAIVAVFVFVVMTVDPGPEGRARERTLMRGVWRVPAAVIALAALPLIGGLTSEGFTEGGEAPVGAKALGALFFGPWAVVTELVSLLLIAAIIGVRVIGRRRPTEGSE